MTIRLDPHRTLRRSDWKPGPWQIGTNGTEPVDCEGFIPHFDYDLDMSFAYEVAVERSSVFEAVGLPLDAEVHAYLVADCQTSNVRLSHGVALTDSPVIRVELNVPSGTMAGAVELSRGLVVVSPGRTAAVGTGARRIGSRLLTDEPFTCRLEGEWARFPMEALDFEQAGLGDAAWFLRLSHDEPDDAFMGSARLLINSAHPAGRAVLEDPEAPAGRLAVSALRSDLIRQLLVALAVNAPDPDHTFPPDSIGSVAESLATDVLASSLTAVLAMARDQPVEFERLIQDRTGYLRTDHE